MGGLGWNVCMVDCSMVIQTEIFFSFHFLFEYLFFRLNLKLLLLVQPFHDLWFSVCFKSN